MSSNVSEQKKETLRSSKDLRLVYIFHLFLILEILTFGIAIYFLNSYGAAFIYTGFGLALVLGNYILCDAIINHNLFQIINYSFLYTFSLINTWLDGKPETGLYLGFKLAFGIIYIGRGGFLLYNISDIYYRYAWSYYKKIGGDVRLQDANKVRQDLFIMFKIYMAFNCIKVYFPGYRRLKYGSTLYPLLTGLRCIIFLLFMSIKDIEDNLLGIICGFLIFMDLSICVIKFVDFIVATVEKNL